MNIKDREFIPLLLGNDINTYSMARAFYEEYGIKSLVAGKYPAGPSCHSKIIEYYADKNLDHAEVFIETVNRLALQYRHKKVILLGCGDNYVELIIKHKESLDRNVVVPYINEQLMRDLITKEKFYQMCEQHGLEYPQTFLYEEKMQENFSLPFGFPIILKPSNGVEYWHNEFPGQKKVYRISSIQDLQRTIHEIYRSGYKDKLIIQDYIPGDDTVIRVMNCFSGKDRKVKLIAMGRVLMEEHTPHGLGNASVIINDYNEEISRKIKGFLEDIEFEGFCCFDIKYDRRDGKLKIFEINLRQGRASYYVTGAGYNLAKYVTAEYVFDKKLDFTIADSRYLYTVIPVRLICRYVKDRKYIDQIKCLVKDKKLFNPLFLKGDTGWRRLIFLLKSQLGQYFKYRRYYN